MTPITVSLRCRAQARMQARMQKAPNLCPMGLLGTVLVIVTSITGTYLPQAIAQQNPQQNPQEPTAAIVPTETIVLGRSPQHHYVVIIPVSVLDPSTPSATNPHFQLLQKIRSVAPQAFLARHALGDYIYVDGFTQFGPAHAQVEQLKKSNSINARVVYFR
jgi:hypothetical protein